MKILACNVRGKLMWKLETWSGGRRKRQFFAKREKAETALADVRRQRDAFGKAFNVLTAREKASLMSILAEIRQAGLTLHEVWQQAKKAPAVAPKGRCTLEDALKEVLEAKRHSGRRPKHLKNMAWYLGKFIQGREKADIASIREAELSAWFQDRKEAPSSQKQHMGLLSALFAHCWRKRYIPENPVHRLEKIRTDQGVPHTLTLAQCRKSLLWARRRQPEFLAWLTLVLLVGMRPESEADLLTWGDIDLKHTRIIVGRTKTRTPRIIELAFCPPALAWLKVAKELGSRLEMPNVTRRRYLRKLRAYLKLKEWPQDVMRHTAASNLLAFHQDAGKVAAFLGNSAGILLKHYKALVFKEDAAKWMALLPKPRHYPNTGLSVEPPASVLKVAFR